MASFEKGGAGTASFGKNEYRHSTKGLKYEPYTLAASTVPVEIIDGVPQKVFQSGEAVAKITSGPEAGKVGPYMVGATDGRADLENLVGINDTFLPYQTMDRDVEIGVCYTGVLKQGWCFEREADGDRIPLSNAAADAMVAKKTISLLFK